MTGLIFGFDDNGLIKPILLDSAGYVKARLFGTQPAIQVYGEEATRQVKTTRYGQTSTGLKIGGMPYGYYSAANTHYVFNTLAAGTNTVNLWVNTATEVTVFTNLAMGHVQARAGVELFFVLRVGVSDYLLFHKIGFTAGQYVDKSSNIVVPPSGILRAVVINGTAGDICEFVAVGFKATP